LSWYGIVALRQRLAASALALLLALGAVGPAPAVVGLLAGFLPGTAEARAGGGGSSRSSGGYSRPSARTPSFSVPRAAPRAPSTSGGYSRPGTSAPAPRRPSVAEPSANDRAISRQSADDAFRRYQSQEAQRRAPPAAAAPSAPPAAPQSRPGGGGGWRGWGGWGAGGGGRPSWYADRGWTAPAWAYGGRRSFGVWDGLFLWFLFDTLTRPGHADWFHNHQDDPGYRQWRQEAERLAAENADIRQKLDTLDRQLAEKRDQPRDPGYLPADAAPEIALAPEADARTPSTSAPAPGAQGGGVGLPMILIVVAGGAIFLYVMRRRRRAAGANARTPPGGQMNPLRTAANIIRHKLSGEGYTPTTRFRVGMTLTLDPTPFILAQDTTKVPVPHADGGDHLVSVAAVGILDGEGVQLTRLYLDERNFFQLHLDQGGTPDECRYFGRIDEVTPADEAEWAFWLDEREGMIGWPEFQTKDGKVYARVWSPGGGRVPPRVFSETVTTEAGTQTLRRQAMLYAAPTGAAPPAPQSEYILISAVDAGGQAWVDVAAGIDVSPAALSLS
jgi:hypothetical protein